MKRLLLPSVLVFLISLLGCKPAPISPPPTNTAESEQEVERRVQQRLAEEQQKQKEKELQQRADELAAREAEIAKREQQAAATPVPTPTTEPVAPQATAGVDVPGTSFSNNDDNNNNDLGTNGADYEPMEDEQPVRERDSSAYTVFYDQLDGDGDWYSTPEYGYVWRPIVAVDLNWRPYTQGRWVYTDCGWTWVSNEPFGWATYHYGRWTRLHDVGWVWVPGRTWGPAWVSWRTGDNVIGWAPLSPDAAFDRHGGLRVDMSISLGASCYAFVPADRFCDSSIGNYIYAPQQNITIINNTKNITHIVRNKNTKVVVNHGPKIALVEGKTKRPVSRLTIERRDEAGSAAVVRGQTLHVAQPVLRERPDAAAKPHRVKQQITKAEVEKDARPAPVSPLTPGILTKPKALIPATPVPAVDAQKLQREQAEAIAREQERQRRIREHSQAKQTPVATVDDSHQPKQKQKQISHVVAPQSPTPTENVAEQAKQSEAVRRERQQREQSQIQSQPQLQQIQQQQEAQRERQRQQLQQEAAREQQQQLRQQQEAQREQQRQQRPPQQEQQIQRQQQRKAPAQVQTDSRPEQSGTSGDGRHGKR